MKTRIKVLLFLMIGINSVAYLGAERSIFLVRHAEKQQDGTKDPALTVQGLKRAVNIATSLANKSIDSIFSTNYQRTLQTAAKLADKNGLKVQLYDPSKLEKFSEKLLSMKGNILVVGHSNTTPTLAYYLDGKRNEELKQPLDEADYQKLYHVLIKDDSSSTSITTRLLLQKVVSDGVTK